MATAGQKGMKIMSLNDTNVGIRLKTGELVEVIYPQRIGIEYETPWLDYEGSRNWNIDPLKNFVDPPSYSPRFIVGKWGTGYQESKGVDRVIPIRLVSNIEALPEEKVQQGLAYAQREEDERVAKQQADPERYVRLKELQALEERIAKLESK